jgi:hypothetical protein
MKNTFLLLCLAVFGIFSQNIMAQLPDVSTAANPVWYYIQVQGDPDGRADRVFTADGTNVMGRAIVVSTADADVSKQLWRFEKDGSNYVIINKSTGKKLDIVYSSSLSARVATLNDNPTTRWQLEAFNGYYTIKATVAPSGGTTDKIYAHQASNWDGKLNYAIIFESTQYYHTPNSLFQFVFYQSANLELSDDTHEIWYQIASVKHPTKCITDVVNQNHPEVKFAIEDATENNSAQQFKLVKKSTTDSKLHFINRSTGNLIQTSSVFNAPYSYTQFTTEKSTSSGWTANYLGSGQYEISGVETEGVTRYLNASSNNADPDMYIENESKDTGFAWMLKKVNTTGINSSTQDNIRIYATNHHVIVEGTDNYIVRTIQGIPVNPAAELPTGIYLVTVNGKTTKVLVD